MSDPLRRLLDSKPCLIADGAMGTSLFAAGLETGGCPELWNVEHPDRITAIHRDFIDAGADIILTNTFGGSRYRLKRQLRHQRDSPTAVNESGHRRQRTVVQPSEHSNARGQGQRKAA